jgi:hypothetical protein
VFFHVREQIKKFVLYGVINAINVAYGRNILSVVFRPKFDLKNTSYYPNVVLLQTVLGRCPMGRVHVVINSDLEIGWAKSVSRGALHTKNVWGEGASRDAQMYGEIEEQISYEVHNDVFRHNS